MSKLAGLKIKTAGHRFWSNRLFEECRKGSLTRADFAYIFSQYHLYNRSFTIYLSSLLAATEDDYFRSKLSENLWEEGGGADLEKRHSELFRRFLAGSLGVDPGKIQYDDAARLFEREFRGFCRTAPAVAACAFLSLGTEVIVPGMYRIFMQGMKSAGLSDSEMEFFSLHVDCDDAHSLTLEEMLESFAELPGWEEQCWQAADHALGLRARFFDSLIEDLQQRKFAPLLAKIQGKRSLAPTVIRAADYRQNIFREGEKLHSRTDAAKGVDFQVTRFPLKAEVLDPRLVRIPAGKSNDRHRHAHETLFYIVKGEAMVLVDETELKAVEGDVVLVPRWSIHESRNTGPDELVILAITDYYLTNAVYLGEDENRKPVKTENK